LDRAAPAGNGAPPRIEPTFGRAGPAGSQANPQANQLPNQQASRQDGTPGRMEKPLSPAPAPQAPPSPRVQAPPPAAAAPPAHRDEPPALDPIDLEKALREFRDFSEEELRADASWHATIDDEPPLPRTAGYAAPQDAVPQDAVPQGAAAQGGARHGAGAWAPAAGGQDFGHGPVGDAGEDHLAGDHQAYDPVDPYDDPAFDNYDDEYDDEAASAEDLYAGSPAEPDLADEAGLADDDAMAAEAGFQAESGEAAPRRRGTFFAVGILLGLVVLGGAFAYVMSNSSAPEGGETPILRADNSPAKIEPADPGGANIPNQDRLVFDRVSGEASKAEEQLVSREEKIMEPAGAGAAGAGRDPRSETGSATPGASADGSPLAPVARRVKTMVVRPDGSIVAAEPDLPRPAEPVRLVPPPAPAPAPSAPSEAMATAKAAADLPKSEERAVSALSSPAANSVPVPPSRPDDAPVRVSSAPSAGENASAPPVTPVRPVRGGPMQLNPNPVLRRPESAAAAPAASRSDPAAPDRSAPAAAPAPEPAPAPRAVASASPAPAASPSGQYVVQLAARKNEEQAQSAYDALKAKYGNLLGRYQPLIQRADLGDRGVYYRVRVGPMASAESAGELCTQLKAAGLTDCLVRQR